MKDLKIDIKWGVIFSAMMLIWMTLEKLGGFHDERIHLHMIVTNLIMIPAIIIYVLALKDKRDNHYGGTMTWLQGFKTGMIMAVIVAILSPVVQLMISKVISPDYFQNAIAHAVESGNSTLEAASAYFNLNNYLMQGAIGAIFMGAITAAIVALFVKKSA